LLMMLSEAGLLVILGRLKSRVWAIWNHELWKRYGRTRHSCRGDIQTTWDFSTEVLETMLNMGWLVTHTRGNMIEKWDQQTADLMLIIS
jgi:hypothetical protein